MLRQFLFDAYESVKLEALTGSQYRPLAEAAAKIRTEEFYHFRHTRAWIRRLGLGTEESRTRLQRALNQLWPLAPALFSPMQGENALVEAGILMPSAVLWDRWSAQVIPILEECGLQFPEEQAGSANPPDESAFPGRDVHTPHLSVLVAELQSVARFDPQAWW